MYVVHYSLFCVHIAVQLTAVDYIQFSILLIFVCQTVCVFNWCVCCATILNVLALCVKLCVFNLLWVYFLYSK